MIAQARLLERDPQLMQERQKATAATKQNESEQPSAISTDSWLLFFFVRWDEDPHVTLAQMSEGERGDREQESDKLAHERERRDACSNEK